MPITRVSANNFHLYSFLSKSTSEFNITVLPSPSIFMDVMLEIYLIKAILHTVVSALLKFPGEDIWFRL